MKYKFAKSSGLPIRNYFLPILHLTLAVLIFAQENYIRFEHISSENGLSQNVVTCILQDKRGFMWFGTQYGLNRFDGYVFKKYKNNPKDPSTLPANIVALIYEDSSGNFWIGTEGGGLSLFNHEKDTFIRFPYKNDSDPNPGTSIDSIMTFHEDRDGCFGWAHGVVCCGLTPKNKHGLVFFISPKFPGP